MNCKSTKDNRTMKKLFCFQNPTISYSKPFKSFKTKKNYKVQLNVYTHGTHNFSLFDVKLPLPHVKGELTMHHTHTYSSWP